MKKIRRYPKTKISDFEFIIHGYGHYKVTYTSPATGKKWYTVTDDTLLIDSTKNEDYPKQKDLEALKYACKNK